MYSLNDPVSSVKYIGGIKSIALNDGGISTVLHLLNYFPYRYRDTTKVLSVKELFSEAQKIPLFTQLTVAYTFRATVKDARLVYTRTRKTMSEIILYDPETPEYEIKAMWFNQPYVNSALKKGSEALFFGKVTIKGKHIIFYNPEFEVITGGKRNIHLGRVSPVYRRMKTISTSYFRRFMEQVKGTESEVTEFIPQKVGKQFEIISLPDAYKKIHFPDNFEQVKKAYKRLAIQELLELRQKFIELNPVVHVKTQKVEIPMKECLKLVGSWKEKLPYKLTKSQDDAVNELCETFLGAKYAQDVFLYGDVGSGKTVTSAIIAALYVIAGFSVLCMAPTTILAEQHFTRFREFFKLWNIPDDKISLITGARKAINDTFNGLIIGTQALLYKNNDVVSNAALVIIDEQHRFGVEQRESLKLQLATKKMQPHVLSLSATPIPRTLAQSYYGFTGAVYMKEKPHKGDNTKTRIVPEFKVDDLYSWITEEVNKKKSQVFMVFPFIEESETMQVAALKEMFTALTENTFKNLRCAMLHGKMKEAEKNQVLEDFRAQKYDILFSTPVIEVGIDIPEARIMVIHNSDRFGLAQLHQLRGRVGRDGSDAFCFLTVSSENESATDRLEYFCKHQNGLDLADYDLKNRGPGEVYGIMQSGIAKLKIADASNFNLIKLSVELYKFLESAHVRIPYYIMNENNVAS